MANILGDDKRQQSRSLGRLGWPLRRIDQATGVRRETASAYRKAAGIASRGPRRRRPPAKPASQVSTDLSPLPPGLAALPTWPPPATIGRGHISVSSSGPPKTPIRELAAMISLDVAIAAISRHSGFAAHEGTRGALSWRWVAEGRAGPNWSVP